MALFVGCGKDEEATDSKDTGSTTTETKKDDAKETEEKEEMAEEVEVNIFQFKVEIVDALENAIEQYKEVAPNVTINLSTVGGGDDYGAALRAQVQSGNEPTIFNVGGPQDVQDWMPKLASMTDAPWADKVLDGVASGVTVDGEVYGLPYNIEGYGLAYNKAIFEAAGIDASTITSYDAMESAFATLKEKIDAGDLADEFPLLEAVVSYAAKETWVTGLHSSNMVFSNEFPGSIETFNAKSIEFKNAEGFKAYLDLMAMYSKHADDTQALVGVDYATQVDEGIALERVAVIQQGNWIYGGVKNVDEVVADNLGFLPLPFKGVQEDSIAVGVPMYWSVNKDDSEGAQKAAMDFLNWLYTSDPGKEIVVNEMFFIPPLKGYDNVQPADPLAQDILAYANDGKTMPWVFMGYPTDWGMGVLGDAIQKYYSEMITFDEVVETVKASWEASRAE
jgi:raffinose/stachyose/melibiose transport system substrate-binding protein